jgi:hypothetical protein
LVLSTLRIGFLIFCTYTHRPDMFGHSTSVLKLFFKRFPSGLSMRARCREFNVIYENKGGSNLLIRQIKYLTAQIAELLVAVRRGECGLVSESTRRARTLKSWKYYKSLKLRFGSIPLSRKRMTDALCLLPLALILPPPLPFTFLLSTAFSARDF